MHFWRLVDPQTLDSSLITGHHNHLVVWAAMSLAIMAAWVLLPVVDRFHHIKGRMRYFWLGAGSTAMGLGIWGMHFTSMLVYHLPFPIEFDPLITTISVVPAILASATSITFYVSAQHSHLRLQQAAICMAVGIGTMHYFGMEAIVVPAEMYYDPRFFLLSGVAAYSLALVGLYAKIYLARNEHLPRWLGVMAGSVILGLAVSSMHHIAMYATYFVQAGSTAAPVAMSHSDASDMMLATSQHLGLVLAIAGSTIGVLGLIVLGTLLDRRMSSMADSLQQSELRFKHLAETTQMAIFTFSRDSITYANPALSAITGYQQQELLNLPLRDVFGPEFMDLANNILNWSNKVGQPFHEQFEIKTKNKETRWLYFSITLAEIDHELSCLASACDVSEQKQAEMTLRKLAYTDQLTSLGNRAMFMDRLQHHLDVRQRRKIAATSCVMLLDLDNFKLINDTYGHMLGDQLLKTIAERLKPLARQCDTVSRLGGDEFAILLEEMNSDQNTTLIAERILLNMKEPIVLNGREIYVNASIGIVVLDGDSHRTPDQVLHDADIALYRAKQEGRCCWKLYDQEIDAKVKRIRQLKTELGDALRKRQLQLFYQPIFTARDFSLKGFEALARWQREGGEWVSPGEFIPIAEEHGMMGELTLCVLETVCSQLAAWRREYNNDWIYCSINVASDSFHDDDFTEQVASNIERHHIRAGQLKLELTERMLVADNDKVLRKLEALIALGCELMIDDFGTGYSSLSYLHRLPVTTLKIDRSFVDGLIVDKGSRSVATSIIALAKSLDLKVISEGVETAEQARVLGEMGSDQLQGYHLGKPVPISQVTSLLVKANAAAATIAKVVNSN